jgi:hypothetical protein
MEWPHDNEDVTGAAGGLPIHPGCSVRTSRRSLRHRRCVGNPHTFDCFCPVVCGRSIFASGDPVSRRARCEYRHRFAIMVPPPSMVPAPLPSLTLAQIQAWDTDHLDTAAAHRTSTAARWRDGFTAVSSGIDRPGGTVWEGASAEAASMRSESDRVQVLGLVERLREASTVARTGAADLAAAKSRTLTSVDDAEQSGPNLQPGTDHRWVQHLAGRG